MSVKLDKPYSSLFITMLDRESGEETSVTIYPATRVELTGQIGLKQVFTVGVGGEWEEEWKEEEEN